MIYRFRATIPESKIFVKEYEVKPQMSLFDLHKFLLNDLTFAPDQMVFFEGCKQGGEICSQYCLFDMGDGAMDKVMLADVIGKEEVELHYVFDMRNDRFINLVFEGEDVESPRMQYPALVMEKGQNPDQFHARFEEAPEFHPFPHVIKGGPGATDDDDFDDDDFDDDEDDDEDDDKEELLVDEDYGKEQ